MLSSQKFYGYSVNIICLIKKLMVGSLVRFLAQDMYKVRDTQEFRIIAV